MADQDQNMPNDASRKSQAEGDRMASDDRKRGANTPGAAADEQAGGITNRPLDEERESQEAVPDRGASRPDAHAGHGDANKERKG